MDHLARAEALAAPVACGADQERPMTALLRIIGCLWLILVVTGIVVTYSLMWIWQGVATATANPPPDAPIGTLAMIAIAVPGLILLGLAAWLDRRHRGWIHAPTRLRR